MESPLRQVSDATGPGSGAVTGRLLPSLEPSEQAASPPLDAGQSEALLEALVLLNEATDLAAGCAGVLQLTATATGAQAAELWLAEDGDKSMTLASSWSTDGPGLASTDGRTNCAPGVGLVGRVWSAGRPEWAPPRGAGSAAADALETGPLHLRQSLALPVPGRDGVGAVLVYHFTAPGPATVMAIEAIAWRVARHLGAFVARMREASEARLAAERMAELAATDPLTSLHNRRGFDRALKAIPRGPFAILSIDVDRLKETNDEYGHAAGDQLLRSVGSALNALVRGSDVIARVGGDEFAAILLGAGPGIAAHVAERFRTAVRAISLPVGRPRVSIGWATADGNADPASVWRTADDSLYAAKAAGGNQVRGAEYGAGDPTGHFHSSYIDLLSVVLLKRTVPTLFQPIVSLADGSVMAYEALARPDGFAPTASVDGLFDAARRTGYMAELDLLCRRAAIKRAAALPAASLLFLNVTPSMLLKPAHALPRLLGYIAKSGRSPHSIVLEISEREHIRDLERLVAVVGSYRKAGIRFAVDDLGEGHTTFELMAASGAEFLKLGRSLTISAARSDSMAAIKATVTFAQATGAEVIAEGIETDEVRDQMRALGIGYGQGFGLAEPVAPENLEHVLVGTGQRRNTASAPSIRVA